MVAELVWTLSLLYPDPLQPAIPIRGALEVEQISFDSQLGWWYDIFSCLADRLALIMLVSF